MKDHIAHMIYLMLTVVFIVVTMVVVTDINRSGTKTFRKGEAHLQEQINEENIGFLSDLEYKKVPTEMPMASLLSMYYEQADNIYDVYDCRTDTNNKVDNIENEGKQDKTIRMLGERTGQKVLVYVTESKYNVNLYDIYIHDIRCEADFVHTGKCEDQPGYNKVATSNSV